MKPVGDLISSALLEGSFPEQMLRPSLGQAPGYGSDPRAQGPPDAGHVLWGKGQYISVIRIASCWVFTEISSCSQSQAPARPMQQLLPFLRTRAPFIDFVKFAVLLFLLLSPLFRPSQTAQGGGHRTLLYGHAILLRHSNSGMVSSAPPPGVGKVRAAVPRKTCALLSPPAYRVRSSLGDL